MGPYPVWPITYDFCRIYDKMDRKFEIANFGFNIYFKHGEQRWHKRLSERMLCEQGQYQYSLNLTFTSFIIPTEFW